MHLYNFHLKHFKTLKTTPTFSIFSAHRQGVSSFLAKVITYSRFSSFDMLPQQLVYKNELNREYVITLARNDETP